MNLKNNNLLKRRLMWVNTKCKKNAWRHHYFTPLYQISQWYDLQFLRYRVWKTDIGNYRSFIALLRPPPFSKNQKIKISKKWKENCWRYHHFTHMYQKTQLLEVQFLRYGRYRDRHNFLKTWAVFCFFTPPNNLEVKILKKWRKHLEISSFETCVPKTTIIWCMLPEIWSVTDTFFCHFWPLLLFYFTTDPENQNLEKM